MMGMRGRSGRPWRSARSRRGPGQRDRRIGALRRELEHLGRAGEGRTPAGRERRRLLIARLVELDDLDGATSHLVPLIAELERTGGERAEDGRVDGDDGADPRRALVLRGYLGLLDARAGEPLAARLVLEDVLVRLGVPDPRDPFPRVVRRQLADVATLLGDHDQAVLLARRVVDDVVELEGEHGREALTSRAALAATLAAAERDDEALPLAAATLDDGADALPVADPQLHLLAVTATAVLGMHPAGGVDDVARDRGTDDLEPRRSGQRIVGLLERIATGLEGVVAADWPDALSLASRTRTLAAAAEGLLGDVDAAVARLDLLAAPMLRGRRRADRDTMDRTVTDPALWAAELLVTRGDPRARREGVRRLRSLHRRARRIGPARDDRRAVDLGLRWVHALHDVDPDRAEAASRTVLALATTRLGDDDPLTRRAITELSDLRSERQAGRPTLAPSAA
jgi:hypothetical protein